MKAIVLALSLALALSAAAQTGAQKTPLEPYVSLDDLVAQALRRNQEILAAQKKFEAARLRPTQESSLPEPMLSLGYRNMGNPLPFTAIGDDPQANAGVNVTQELPFPGKLKLRGQMAQKEANAAFREYQSTELRVVARLKQAYYQLHYLYKALDSLAKNKDLLEKFTKITESRYTVGKAQQQDILKAQVEQSILINRQRKLEQEKQTLKAEINALFDRAPESPLGRPADYQKAKLRASLDELYAKAETNSPVLKREQAMVEKSQAGMDLARRDYYPDFAIMGGYANAGPFPPMYEFRFDLKLPIYFWRKQRAAVQEQSNNLSAARHQYQGMSRMLNFGVKEAYLAAQTSDELIKLYSGGILPQATLTLESSLASYQVGAVDFLTLLMNFRTVLDYEVNYYEEVAAYQKALARLEELTGVSLT